MKHRFTCAAAFVATVAGCATYHPLLLQGTPQFPVDASHVVVQAEQMPLPPPLLSSHRFDPSDDLDMTEVAMLAVANNPQLKVVRDESGIAQAQAFAAGLLPGPQLSFARDVATNGGAGSTSALSLGLSHNVNALLTRSAVKSGAQAAQRQTDLTSARF